MNTIDVLLGHTGLEKEIQGLSLGNIAPSLICHLDNPVLVNLYSALKHCLLIGVQEVQVLYGAIAFQDTIPSSFVVKTLSL